MKNYIYIIISINLVCFISCKKEHYIFIEKDFNNTIIIEGWKAIGPFKFDTITQTGANSFYNKDLELYGVDEDNFNESDLKKIEISECKVISIKNTYDIINLFDYISGNNTIQDLSNFYLYTNIESECEQEVTFIFDGSSSYNIWLNKEKILSVLNKENTVKYGEYFLRIQLKKGKNSLFIKVNRGNNQYSWCFLGVITSTKKGKTIWKEKYSSDFVKDPQISDSIKVYLGPHKYAQLQIKDLNYVDIFSTPIYNKYNQKPQSISSRNLADGFYITRLIIENDSIDEIIYKGDIISFINKMRIKIKKTNYKDQIRDELNTIINRLDFLISRLDNRSEAGTKYYHRNIIFYSKNLLDLMEYVMIHNDTKNFSGTILKTFYESGNDKIQHYLFHVDKKTLKNKLSLIIFIPYEINEKSLPESWYIGNLDPITLDIKDAEQYNFALAWVFLKGPEYSTSNEAICEIRDVINAVKKDYNIDENQIYLNGECVGGSRALLIAAKASKLFAALSVKSPITMKGKKGEKPYEHIQFLNDMPIAIRHGIYDNRVSIKDTRSFVEAAKKAGVSINYTETLSSHISITNIDRRYNFVFFDSIRAAKLQIIQ